MTVKFIWATRVMAVTAFLACSYLVYEIVVNVATRHTLCAAITKENREVIAPQVKKGIEQTKQIHIKGFSDAQRQASIKQGRQFLTVLNKPVCS